MFYYVRSIITNRNRATANIKIGNSAIGKLVFSKSIIYLTIGFCKLAKSVLNFYMERLALWM